MHSIWKLFPDDAKREGSRIALCDHTRDRGMTDLVQAPYRFTLHSAIRDLDPEQWDALAGQQVFTRHAFLSLLEEHGCVGNDTGWVPAHAALHCGDVLVAAMPLYIKNHSWGEYVFDWAWADAYAHHGLRYYPKALCAIPFTPVPGARLLGIDAPSRRNLLSEVLAWCREVGLSSLHVLFPDEPDLAAGQALGLLRRSGVQFHWQSYGETCFDDFLARLNHEKRKKIRQDRRYAQQGGLQFVVREGLQIRSKDWDFFDRCYRHTYALHRSTPYLSRDFFGGLGEVLPESCVMIIAQRGDEPIASSLMLRDEDALYGRYWGALEYQPSLHFECCYYQGIDYAIQAGLKRFEGGAQGEHKLARGLQPVETYSMHWLADARFANAVSNFLDRETGGIESYLDELRERSPFRKEKSE